MNRRECGERRGFQDICHFEPLIFRAMNWIASKLREKSHPQGEISATNCVAEIPRLLGCGFWLGITERQKPATKRSARDGSQ